MTRIVLFAPQSAPTPVDRSRLGPSMCQLELGASPWCDRHDRQGEVSPNVCEGCHCEHSRNNVKFTPTIASARCTVVDIKLCPVFRHSCASSRTPAVGLIHCAANGVSPEGAEAEAPSHLYALLTSSSLQVARSRSRPCLWRPGMHPTAWHSAPV